MSKIKRPMCLFVCLFALTIILADLLGISWIWRSPAGPVPESAGEKITAQGEVYDQAGVIALSKIPSKDVLLAQLVGSLQGPLQKLAATVKALADKKAEEEAA